MAGGSKALLLNFSEKKISIFRNDRNFCYQILETVGILDKKIKISVLISFFVFFFFFSFFPNPFSFSCLFLL